MAATEQTAYAVITVLGRQQVFPFVVRALQTVPRNLKVPAVAVFSLPPTHPQGTAGPSPAPFVAVAVHA